MFARTVAALTFAAAAFTAVPALAAETATLDGLIAETKAAAVTATSVDSERTQRTMATISLGVAESLAREGKEASALSHLNYARGQLGLLPVVKGQLSVAER